MTDPKAFFKTLIDNPETKASMKTIKNTAESYGEDKDKYLNYLIGAIASWYDSAEMMIANIEAVKLLTMLRSIEQGMIIYQDTLRENHKSEAAKPV